MASTATEQAALEQARVGVSYLAKPMMAGRQSAVRVAETCTQDAMEMYTENRMANGRNGTMAPGILRTNLKAGQRSIRPHISSSIATTKTVSKVSGGQRTLEHTILTGADEAQPEALEVLAAEADFAEGAGDDSALPAL